MTLNFLLGLRKPIEQFVLFRKLHNHAPKTKTILKFKIPRLQISLHSFEKKKKKKHLSPLHFLTIQPVTIKPEVGNSEVLWESVLPACWASGGQRREITINDTSLEQRWPSDKATLFTPLVNQSNVTLCSLRFCARVGLIHRGELGYEVITGWCTESNISFLYSYLRWLLTPKALTLMSLSFLLVSCLTAPPAGYKYRQTF